MKRNMHILATLVVVIAAVSLPAVAVDDIIIPIDTVVRSDEGALTQLAVVNVEPEAIGASCVVSAEGENNTSVHPNNDIIVSSGSDQVTLFDVEGVGGGITTASGTLTLGDTIVLTLRMGPDRVFSGGLTVTVDCEAQPEPTTTTTEPPTTTTTEPTTTTTEPPTTTTTEPTTTTTEPPTTTTTEPPDATSTSTTAPAQTTTTNVEDHGTTTTSPTEVRGVQIQQSDELPFTGISTEIIAAVGFALIATGFLVRRLATERDVGDTE